MWARARVARVHISTALSFFVMQSSDRSSGNDDESL